jgi:hypothetical protein
MRRMTVVSLALLVTTAGLARADGLGDAARRAKAKRDETKKTEPATVLTNDSILAESEEKERPTRGTFNAPPPKTKPPASVPLPPPASPRSGSGSSGVRSGSYVPEVNVSSAGRRESASQEPDPDAEKRALAAAYKSQLVAIDARIRAAEAAMAQAAEEAEHVYGGTSRERYARAYEAAEKAWAEREAIEDAARRHNIPPGWIR